METKNTSTVLINETLYIILKGKGKKCWITASFWIFNVIYPLVSYSSALFSEHSDGKILQHLLKFIYSGKLITY